MVTPEIKVLRLLHWGFHNTYRRSERVVDRNCYIIRKKPPMICNWCRDVDAFRRLQPLAVFSTGTSREVIALSTFLLFSRHRHGQVHQAIVNEGKRFKRG